MGIELKNITPINQRWIMPYNRTLWATYPATAIGRTYLSLISIPQGKNFSKIAIFNFATVAGNVTVGIYGPLPLTSSVPDGLPLIVESASTVLAGVNQTQEITIPTTYLSAGDYYLAAEYSDASHTFGRIASNSFPIEAGGFLYTRGGGYGALTNPCPATGTTTVLIALALG